MNAQQLITRFLVELVLQEALKNREETKIFIPKSFAQQLEHDFHVTNYKDIFLGGYRIVCGPFREILAYNKAKNVQLAMKVNGEFVKQPK